MDLRQSRSIRIRPLRLSSRELLPTLATPLSLSATQREIWALMNSTDWVVIAAGAAVIGWVYWYFFVTSRAAASVPGVGSRGLPEITITVKGGYEPAQIRVKSGQPVRLTFDRQETSSCSEEIVFPDFGVKRFLPPFEKTTIELTPPRPGKYGFMCGMSMLHGSLIAE